MTVDVLVVEDDEALRQALCDTLELSGLEVLAARDGEAALRTLQDESARVVVSDIQMRPMNGMRFLSEMKERHAEVPVVLMTAYATVQQAVKAMQEGAADYLVKPFEGEVLVSKVISHLRSDMSGEGGGMIAVDAVSQELSALAARVAESPATVMITGESGTGKEVLARFIHRCSARAEGPFVAINCAAIPENMLEALLFGYEKGAFTGAYKTTAGKFEQADGGTLLLDEISEMALGLQSKLLRVLQEREVERLGGNRVIPLDVRVLATSNKDMRAEVREGRFREDLYYRLNVFPLHLAPLRERPDDIVPLAEHLMACRADSPAPGISEGACVRLLEHDWPGNVRELDNVIQRSLILYRGGEIQARDLLFEQQDGNAFDMGETMEPSHARDAGLGDDLRQRERELIVSALREGGNRKKAAAILGISPRTLRYKLQRLREAGSPLPEGI